MGVVFLETICLCVLLPLSFPRSAYSRPSLQTRVRLSSLGAIFSSKTFVSISGAYTTAHGAFRMHSKQRLEFGGALEAEHCEFDGAAFFNEPWDGNGELDIIITKRRADELVVRERGGRQKTFSPLFID